MDFLSLKNVTITEGFWKNRQQLNAETTVHAVYKQFEKTGRFACLNHAWREGQPGKPHIFWDSDVAKWLESAAYILSKHDDKELYRMVDETINLIIDNQEKSGYFNSWYQTMAPHMRFTDRTEHELYCAGHLMEAAVACYEALGDERMLQFVRRYAEYIERVFVREGTSQFVTPGHEEIELALIRLFNLTGERSFLLLANFFIDNRGLHGEATYAWANGRYLQDFLPVREQRTAEGHAVRACYLYSAMADLARINNDSAMLDACKAIFDNIMEKRMYITGGIGSAANGEAFTIDYDLPNLTAYAESCAAIGLVYFAKRMLMNEVCSKYADVIERVLYNGFLSSVSLDGKSFFYENPLEIYPPLKFRDASMGDGTTRLPITQRVEVFECSCCPPNITRLIATLGEYVYSHSDDTFFIHQYISSKTDDITVTTDYPANGKVLIKYSGKKKLAFRIPWWCESFTVTSGGTALSYRLNEGYAYLEQVCNDVEINLDMPLVLVEANPMVIEDAGRAALMKGPIVFCIEGNDYPVPLKSLRFADTLNEEWFLYNECGLPGVIVDGIAPRPTTELYRKCSSQYDKLRLKFIPYYAFANNGETQMQVWLLKS